MPNWTYNQVRMKGIGNNENLFSYSEKGEKYFDFNKIVPEPKSEEECREKYGEKYIDNGACNLSHDESDKWFNWYSWHCDFWGTKWNACDSYVVDDNLVTFDTAWSEPREIWIALSKMFPDKTLFITANYEDGFVTKSKFKNGELLSYKEEDA